MTRLLYSYILQIRALFQPDPHFLLFLRTDPFQTTNSQNLFSSENLVHVTRILDPSVSEPGPEPRAPEGPGPAHPGDRSHPPGGLGPVPSGARTRPPDGPVPSTREPKPHPPGGPGLIHPGGRALSTRGSEPVHLGARAPSTRPHFLQRAHPI